jgi:hypothetical protein
MATIGAISALQLQLLFMMNALDDGYDENGTYRDQVEEIQLAIELLLLEETNRPGKGNQWF